MTRTKRWSWSTGMRPFTVRVTEFKEGGNVYVVRIRNGRQVMRSLGHRNRERAKAKAMEISADLANGSNNEGDFPRRPLKLGKLADLYELNGLHGRTETYRKEQARKVHFVAKVFGRDREVLSLSESDVRRFAEQRLSGKIGHGKPVRLGTVWSELTALKIACSWGVRHRVNGNRKLLSENPLYGISIPQESSPRRPVASEARYLALRKIAPEFNPLFALALDLAWATGHRIGAIRHLSWEDIDFTRSEVAPFGSIRWRQEHDKTRHEHVVPMNEIAFDALTHARREAPGIGKSWVFPQPGNPRKACGRYQVSRWLREAEEEANLEKIPGGGWHAFRRAWATARKNYPLKDVAVAGGWKDTTCLLRAYTHSDPETVLGVVVNGG